MNKIIEQESKTDQPNLGGRPHELTEDVAKKIVAHYKKTIVLRNVAGHVRKHPDTIKTWLRSGELDIFAGKETKFSRFYLDVKEARAAKIKELEDSLLAEEPMKNWQRIAWYLERCAREDYGIHGDIYDDLKQQIIDVYALVAQLRGMNSNFSMLQKGKTINGFSS